MKDDGVIVYEPKRIAKNLKEVDTETLKSELAKSLTLTAQHLLYLSEIWRELELRGEDMSQLKSGLGQYLPLIAAGALKAEAVIKFAGQKMLLKRIAHLPPGVQLKLSSGEKIPVVYHDTVSDTIKQADLSCDQLSSAQIRTVFDSHKIRSEDEQYRIVTRAAVGASRTAGAGPFRIDPSTGLAKVGRGFVKRGEARVHVSDVVEALSAYYDVDVGKLIEMNAPKLPPAKRKPKRA